METSRAHFYFPKGVLFVEGEDAASFLQGQFSQDLKLPDGSKAYGLWLNHKGKILADSSILKIAETRFLVVSYFGETELLRENLEERIIMDEVETRSPELEWFGISVWGEAIDCVLELVQLDRPSEHGYSSTNDVFVYWGRRGKEPSLEILFINGTELEGVKSRLSDMGIRLLTDDAVRGLALRDRYFQVGRDVAGADLPQEVGLSSIAVSYTKGCYIGQEVMARLKSMGRPRRTLDCVTVSKSLEGEGPWNLLASDGTRAGELRKVISDGDEFVGAAMIKRSLADENTFEVAGESASVTRQVSQGSLN